MEITKKSTKDKILTLLKREVVLTVNELTELLDITHMAVRKHLNVLDKDGFIITNEVRQPMGRPIQTFSLSEKAEVYFPKNYDGISLEFLHDIEELYGNEAIQRLFDKRQERLTNEYDTRMHNKTASEKVTEMVKIQNEKGYMAGYSQIDETTYELVEYNCPILSVAREFKTACSCETDMLKSVLGTEDVSRTCCRTDGDHFCKFVVKFDEVDKSIV
ncbi:transcriptional regulator [Paenibacillus sp. SC116]|uniref:helix-turn-helix transcriptional regulator n=1 Tax=Paenibacillus sp. SC116 TaxID=2968986 RepID=UPI00215A6537|nr:metalloregulator ArsR/SmtB family transcription factor [Paenibacillus sp. SC116]MCR8842388.1 transcriptional regulator [Paenibacillus sp. SC116]